MKRIRLILGGGLVLASAALLAATGAVTAVPPLPPDCWGEHSQIQPSPPRQGQQKGKDSGGPAFRPMTEQHPGAEHPTRAQLRPCAPPRGAAGLEIRAADSPGLKPPAALP